MKIAKISCPELLSVWATSPNLRMYLGGYKEGDVFASPWQDFNQDWNWVLGFQDYLCNIDSPEYAEEVRVLKSQFKDNKITYRILNVVEL